MIEITSAKTMSLVNVNWKL